MAGGAGLASACDGRRREGVAGAAAATPAAQLPDPCRAQGQQEGRRQGRGGGRCLRRTGRAAAAQAEQLPPLPRQYRMHRIALRGAPLPPRSRLASSRTRSRRRWGRSSSSSRPLCSISPPSTAAAATLLLNTCGWVTGLGGQLLADIVACARPTVVVMIEGAASASYPNAEPQQLEALEAAAAAGAQIIRLPALPSTAAGGNGNGGVDVDALAYDDVAEEAAGATAGGAGGGANVEWRER